MIRLIQRRLIIPRGDTGTFTVPLITKGDTGDVALFSIFDLSTKRKVFEKIVDVTGDTFTVEFNHNDTVNLPAGKYAWDIKFYQNPEFADGVLINGTEIDSYYAAYDLPVCEIRETGDLFLTADDAPTSTLPPESLNIISAAVSEATTAKNTSTVNAEIAANAATTAHEDAEAASAAAAHVEELIEQLPSIPTKVSDLIDDSGHYTKPETGIPASDLAETYLTSFTETDPTVPAWAKASAKPVYTAQEVGALPADTVIPTVPTNVSAFTNDAGYLTQHQDISGKANSADLATVATSGSYNDLSNKPTIPARISDLIDDSNHYTKPVTGIPASDLQETYLTSFTETDPTVPAWAKAAQKPAYTAAEVGATTEQQVSNMIASAIGNINSFDMAVVQTLPAENISNHTIYLVPKTGEINDVYDEYIYVNNAWEMIGNTQVDLSNYATLNDIPTNVSVLTNDAGYLTQHQDISGKANTADLATVATSGSYNDLSNKPTIPTVPVQDVQVDGTSILSSGVANIPMASSSALGLVKINTSYGVIANPMTGELTTWVASSEQVKLGTEVYRPLTPVRQHEAAFYGLAKAAGDTTQSQSDNAVGTYTDTAKTAIQTMLGVPSTSAITVSDVQINNASIITNKIATIPLAGESRYGVIRVGNGLSVSRGVVSVYAAVNSQIKEGTNTTDSIVPYNQHIAAFYGLAKAAGDATQSASTNAVGSYTDGAKTSIQTMLDVPSKNDLIIPEIVVQGTYSGTTIVSISLSMEPGTYRVSVDNVTSTDTDNTVNMLRFVNSVTAGDTEVAYFSLKRGEAFTGTFTTESAFNTIYLYGSYNYPQSVDDEFTFTNLTVEWLRPLAEAINSKVKDVQADGISVNNNGIANIPIASSSTAGVVKITNYNHGLWMAVDGTLRLDTASATSIKAGTGVYAPITPYNQHSSVFYGLAKIAGDTTQANSNNTAGEYTETAKSKINTMLSGAVTITGTTPTINAQSNVSYICGEVSTLSITLPSTGIVDIIFKSGTTPTVLSITPPSGVTIKWPAWFDPTSLRSVTTYELNILNGEFGVVGVWS